MRKIYILDTSALIDNPSIFKFFPNSDIIIPIIVINELDKIKTYPGEAGKNARVSIKLLDQISSKGDISAGVLLNDDDDTLIKIDTNYRDIKDSSKYYSLGDPSYGDTHILACAIDFNKNFPENEVTLVSNDFNLRIQAKARGINSIEYDGPKCLFDNLYSGIVSVSDNVAALELQNNGFIDSKQYELDDLYPNECVIFESDDGTILSTGRMSSSGVIKLVRKIYPWSISSRNAEQSFAMDLIADKDVNLITLIGRSGGGKTLITLASALELTINRREYNKLIIYRPIQSVGNEIGFLPGTMEEKLLPWFQAIMDNFEILFTGKNGGNWRAELEMYQKKSRIEMECISHIRGRSIPNAIVVVDEAQNLTKEDIKTILTRVGENTKIILNGDIEQIDNSRLDATNNGLTYVIEKFKEYSLAGHITFSKGERSKLATLSSEIL